MIYPKQTTGIENKTDVFSIKISILNKPASILLEQAIKNGDKFNEDFNENNVTEDFKKMFQGYNLSIGVDFIQENNIPINYVYIINHSDINSPTLIYIKSKTQLMKKDISDFFILNSDRVIQIGTRQYYIRTRNK